MALPRRREKCLYEPEIFNVIDNQKPLGVLPQPDPYCLDDTALLLFVSLFKIQHGGESRDI